MIPSYANGSSIWYPYQGATRSYNRFGGSWSPPVYSTIVQEPNDYRHPVTTNSANMMNALNTNNQTTTSEKIRDSSTGTALPCQQYVILNPAASTNRPDTSHEQVHHHGNKRARTSLVTSVSIPTRTHGERESAAASNQRSHSMLACAALRFASELENQAANASVCCMRVDNTMIMNKQIFPTMVNGTTNTAINMEQHAKTQEPSHQKIVPQLLNSFTKNESTFDTKLNNSKPVAGIVTQLDKTKGPRSIATTTRRLVNTVAKTTQSSPSHSHQVFAKMNDDALELLSSSCLERRLSKTPYIDASVFNDPSAFAAASRRARTGVSESFPEKLYRMLVTEAAREENDDIISFFPHGRAFGIFKPDRFVKEILPKYFKQTRLDSFRRQLNIYGFSRLNTGRDSGGYYHELFLRGRPALHHFIARVGAPKEVRRKRGAKPHDSLVDPNFYAMAPIRQVVVVNEHAASELPKKKAFAVSVVAKKLW